MFPSQTDGIGKGQFRPQRIEGQVEGVGKHERHIRTESTRPTIYLYIILVLF
jgi:hypothetical protein